MGWGQEGEIVILEMAGAKYIEWPRVLSQAGRQAHGEGEEGSR